MSETKTTITVFGGLPAASGASSEEGFSEWAATVHDRPMPVKYSLMSFSTLDVMKGMEKTYEKMVEAYIKKHGKTLAELEAANEKAREIPNYIKISKGGAKLAPGVLLKSANGKARWIFDDKDFSFEITYEGMTIWKETRGKIGCKKAADMGGDHSWFVVVDPLTGGIGYTNKFRDRDKDIKNTKTLLVQPFYSGDPYNWEECKLVVSKVKLRNNGNLEVIDVSGKVLWYSGTGGPDGPIVLGTNPDVTAMGTNWDMEYRNKVCKTMNTYRTTWTECVLADEEKPKKE
jgi:hypothetical protein